MTFACLTFDGTAVEIAENLPGAAGDPQIMLGEDAADYVAVQAPGIAAPLADVAVEGQSLASSVMAYVAEEAPQGD